jgi:hypothetical protein
LVDFQAIPEREQARKMGAHTKAKPTEAIAVVDPVSTGANVALEALTRGYAVIALWTLDLPASFRSHVPQSVAAHLSFFAEVEEQLELDATTAALRAAVGSLKLVGCICGCESGVNVADRVSEAMGVRPQPPRAAARAREVAGCAGGEG